MTKYLPWVGGGVLAFLLLALPQCAPNWGKWSADTTRVFAQVDSARLLRVERDSLRRFIAERLQLAGREDTAAKYLTRVSRRFRLASDSLGRLLPTLQTTSDSLLVTRRRVETLQVALDTLEASQARTEASNSLLRDAVRGLVADTLRLHVSDSAGWASVDSLRSLVRRAPTGRERWWLPRITAGYGAVVSDGTLRVGPGVQAGFQIKF